MNMIHFFALGFTGGGLATAVYRGWRNRENIGGLLVTSIAFLVAAFTTHGM